jgi:Raf kinase inhibitor-like YbhB/YbcL family protein
MKTTHIESKQLNNRGENGFFLQKHLIALFMLLCSVGFFLDQSSINAAVTVPTDFIDLTNNGLSPIITTVRLGTNVTWRNQTDEDYLLQSGYPYNDYLPLIGKGAINRNRTLLLNQPQLDPRLRSNSFGGQIPANGDWSHRFEQVGQFPYFAISTSQKIVTGVVIVEGATPTPTPTATKTAVFTLSSTAFAEGGLIPTPYTFNAPPQCSGQNISVPLVWQGVPDGTNSFALIMDDPDAANFVHWVQFNIPKGQNSLPQTVDGPEIGIKGRNDFGQNGYGGPCPPSGIHRYIFTLYALDNALALAEGASKADVVAAMAGHILQQTQLTGIRHP